MSEEFRQLRIGVVGLGYVGLPLALALAKHFGVIGFDTDQRKVALLKDRLDPIQEGLGELLGNTSAEFVDHPAALASCNFYILTVPTPIDIDKTPDLSILLEATKTVAQYIKVGDIVVYESTVYPGVTEDQCCPLLESVSKLTWRKDFFVGYSPERINPGDVQHSLDSVIKIISADSPETLKVLHYVYSKIVKAGLFEASSIKVAEAAKVIENVQRDLNIALVNELAIIFDRLELRTTEVLEAAGSKWNFLPFSPGLVGGHCIGVDPFYLTARAQQVGYHPEIILAGRRINDGMGRYVARKLVKILLTHNVGIKGNRVGILGVSFKEDVADFRNSRVPDIVSELAEYGIESMLSDPKVDADEFFKTYGIELVATESLQKMDALILAVPHTCLIEYLASALPKVVRVGGVIMDVKSKLDRKELEDRYLYWSL